MPIVIKITKLIIDSGSGYRGKAVLGEAVKITAILNVDTATCTITIEDPSLVDEVTNVVMTKEADCIYSYIWQNVDDSNEGDYKVTVKAVSGNYTSIKVDKFELIDIDDIT
jgi:hypothetical protein